MVKADAYGHGFDPLADTFTQSADELGVATVDEGLRVRARVPAEFPVFVMSRAKDWDLPDAVGALSGGRLIPALSSTEEVRRVLDRLRPGAGFPIELKLDTGMGRLGIQEPDLEAMSTLLENADGRVRVVGIVTHFAAADETDLGPTWEQERRFRRMVTRLRSDLFEPAALHSCNSGALLHRGLGETGLGQGTTVVRPGVMMYGAAPSAPLQQTRVGHDLREVGRWSTSVLEVRTIPPGGGVGYGGTWRAEGPEPATVAVLALGYADGYRRTLGNRGRVLIQGAPFPVIGRVSMDLVSVEVDGRIRVGDEAVVLGSQTGPLGRDTIPAWELASLCDTIPYEIWTSIGPRVARRLAGR